jgi:hypothetical protein
VLAFLFRLVSVIRNKRITLKSDLLGVRHLGIVQIMQGFLGGSFNTREYFHGASDVSVRNMKYIFFLLSRQKMSA